MKNISFLSEKETFWTYYPYLIKYKGFFTTKIFYEIYDEIEALESRVTEGDNRYSSLWEESLPLYFMILTKGIIESKKKINKVIPLIEKNRIKLKKSPWNNVQTYFKMVLTSILEKKGYDNFQYETTINSGRLDVYACHPTTHIEIIGECGPCRISKIIEALKCNNRELWHLDKKSILWKYKRGPNWDRIFTIYQKIETIQINILFDKIREGDLKNSL